MTFACAPFAPWNAVSGGALIGLATSLLLLAIGRATNVSAIVEGLLDADRVGGRSWRVAFIVGLLIGPSLASLFVPMHAAMASATRLEVVIGGALVGVGAHYASGCTTGHGIYGLARSSPRSFVAASLCSLAALLTVFVLRHALGSAS